MAINVDRHLDRAVPHLPLNVINIFALLNLDRAKGVAQIMPAKETDCRQVRFRAHSLGIPQGISKTAPCDVARPQR